MNSHPTATLLTRTTAPARALLLGLATLTLSTIGFAQPAHLENGLQLVDEITSAQAAGVFTGDVNGATVFLNRYGGSWNTPGDESFIRFLDVNTGTYAANYTTCAPLVSHLLKYTYAWDWKQVGVPDPLNGDALAYKSSPKSYLYVSAIKNQIGFATHVTELANVQPGDIAARWEVGTDEGHTMIIVSVDTASAKAYPASSTDVNFIPALAGSTYTEVTVLDSSASGHTNDTRMITYNGTTALSGGVGTGVMGIFTDSQGHIIGHTWSLPTSSYLKTSKGVTTINPSWLSGIKSRIKLQADVELVIGRLPALTVVAP
jgi:hypothetical protein